MQRSPVVAGIIVFIRAVFVGAQGVEDNCEAVDGSLGRCSTVAECPGILRLADSFPLTQFLSSQCGRVGETVYICCPVKKPATSQSLSRPQQDNIPKKVTCGTRKNQDEFPYLAAVGKLVENDFLLRCSALIISERHLITGAQCFNDDFVTDARAGVDRLRFGMGQDRKVSRISKHPEYDPTKPAVHDIAVVELWEAFIYNDKVRPACVSTASGTGPSLHLLGYLVEPEISLLRNAEKETYATKANMLVRAVRTRSCQRGVPFPLERPKHLCVNSLSYCRSRLVSPILLENVSRHLTVVGVGSADSGDCTKEPNVQVYTRISTYVEWIRTVTTPRGRK